MDLKETITDAEGKRPYENELESVLEILHASALAKQGTVLKGKGDETSRAFLVGEGVWA